MSSTPISPTRSRYFTSLKLKRRIDQLFKTGRKIFGRHLMLRFEVCPEPQPPFHVVFAVSSKLGPAAFRNRIKRRLRESLLIVLRDGSIRQAGFDLAIVPRKEVAELDFAELCADLRKALRQLKRPTS